jgi:murein DD-endopeptidase MepM/ murein hydrolase activator NlpD
MRKDKITVMILPRDGGAIRQYAVPVPLLWTAGILSILFVLGNLFLLADYFNTRVDQARLEALTRENQFLSQHFSELKMSIAGLRNDYGTLVAKEEAIRTIFDLPAIDPEARLLGVGGPTDPELDRATVTAASAMRTSANVDELLRLAKFEKERFQEVYEQLAGRKERLDHTPSIMPTRGYVSRGFGYKNDPFTGMTQFHTGLDIANRRGTPINASASGKIVAVQVTGGLGKTIVIDHGFGYKTRYGHLNEYNVKVGQKVNRGDLICYMGNTGYSTGPHLHYEVLKDDKPVNPFKYILNN